MVPGFMGLTVCGKGYNHVIYLFVFVGLKHHLFQLWSGGMVDALLAPGAFSVMFTIPRSPSGALLYHLFLWEGSPKIDYRKRVSLF